MFSSWEPEFAVQLSPCFSKNLTLNTASQSWNALYPYGQPDSKLT